MAIVLLLILAALWVALLLPPHLRNRAENRPADSIGDFRHQLRVLDRIGPTAVSPANSLRGARRPMPSLGLGLSRPASVRHGGLAADVVAARRYAAARAMSSEAIRRRSSQRRRRDILFSLVCLTGLSAIIGFVPGLSVLWFVTAVVGVLLMLYVAVLVQMRNRSAERDMKVRFLPAGAGAASGGGVAGVRAPDPSPVPAPAFAYRRTAR